MYYTWVNIATLNALRKARGPPLNPHILNPVLISYVQPPRSNSFSGMRTFDLRPHCGESGALNHLSSAFLLSNGINHGIQLANSTPLQVRIRFGLRVRIGELGIRIR